MRTAGTVNFCNVMGANGRSKGCGLVEFATPEEAQNAIRTLHDSELDGRRIFCREDREVSRHCAGLYFANTVAQDNAGINLERQHHVRAVMCPLTGRLLMLFCRTSPSEVAITRGRENAPTTHQCQLGRMGQMASRSLDARCSLEICRGQRVQST